MLSRYFVQLDFFPILIYNCLWDILFLKYCGGLYLFFSGHFNVVASVLFDITKILQHYFCQY